MTDPRPVSDIDQDAHNALQLSVRFIYGLMISLGVLVIILGVIVGVLVSRAVGERSRTTQQIDQIVSNLCGFVYPVAVAPVDAKQTTKLGIELVEGARQAVPGLDCPDKLGPPPPSLIQLGQKYSIPIR